VASIKRFPGSRYWYACFTLPNKARRQVSTKTENKEEATQIALSYEKASRLASSKRWNDNTARRILREIAQISGYRASDDGESIRHFLTERRGLIPKRYKGRTLEKCEFTIDDFLRGHADTADQPMTDFLPRDAAAWRDKLLRTGLAPATINFRLSFLEGLWREAILQDLVDVNPFTDVRVPGQNKNRQVRKALPFEKFEALLAALRKTKAIEHAAEWRLLVKVAGYTGQRERDCATFDKANVDRKRRVMKFWRSKNKDFLEVPIHPALWPDLAAALKKEASGFLMPAMAAMPATGRRSISDVFRQKILPLIGIVQPYNNSGGRARRIAPYSFHSLRHGLSTWLNTAGVSDVDRRAVVGHADRNVSMGYTHAELQNARRAVELLPAVKN
jgi:integrase